MDVARRVEDEDLDRIDQAGDQDGAEKEKEDKKKPIRKPVIKVDPGFLVDGPSGLKRLYKRMVVDGEKNIHLKGKGNEVNDFNKVMNQMRSWHFESMGKLEVSFFAERVAKTGNDKAVKAFMNKLRLVHKGLEVLDEDLNQQPSTEEQPGNSKPAAPMFQYIDTTTTNGNRNQYDDYANFLNQKSVPAGQFNKQQQQPYFKLMDPQLGGPATQAFQESQTQHHDLGPIQTNHSVKASSELTDQQMKMIEDNRLKAQERKRKREEAMGLESEVPDGSKPPSKQVVVVEPAKIYEQLGFAIAYGANDEEVVDLNEEDMEEYMDGVDYSQDFQKDPDYQYD